MLYAPRYATLHASAPAHRHTDQSQRTNTDTQYVTQQTPDTAQHSARMHTAADQTRTQTVHTESPEYYTRITAQTRAGHHAQTPDRGTIYAKRKKIGGSGEKIRLSVFKSP